MLVGVKGATVVAFAKLNLYFTTLVLKRCSFGLTGSFIPIGMVTLIQLNLLSGSLW